MNTNKSIIGGRLGKDPELSYLTSGTAVCKFSVATSRIWKNKDGEKQEDTQWHNVEVFGKLAELVGTKMKKGGRVFLEGYAKTDQYEDSEGVKKYFAKVIAERITIIDFAESEGGSDEGYGNGNGDQ